MFYVIEFVVIIALEGMHTYMFSGRYSYDHMRLILYLYTRAHTHTRRQGASDCHLNPELAGGDVYCLLALN